MKPLTLSLMALILILGTMLVYHHVTHIEMTATQLIAKFWFCYFAMFVGVLALILKSK